MPFGPDTRPALRHHVAAGRERRLGRRKTAWGGTCRRLELFDDLAGRDFAYGEGSGLSSTTVAIGRDHNAPGSAEIRRRLLAGSIGRPVAMS